METRTEKDRYDMAVPQFQSEVCESCFKPAELIDKGKVIVSNGFTIKLSYCVCMDCLKELRPVSDITHQMRHEFNKLVYYRMYDTINYKGKIHVSQKGE